MKFYCYLLIDQGIPFYVGKGTRSRIHAHAREARRGHKCRKCNKIRKLWREGRDYTSLIVFRTDSEQDAFALEISLIAGYRARGVRLTNRTDGGAGPRGLEATESTRQKLRAMRSTSEYREHHSLLAKAYWNQDEARERRRAIVKATWADPEHHAQRVAKQRGPEYHAKQQAVQKQVWADPEKRAARIAGLKKQAAAPEAQAKRSAAMKAVRAKRDAHIRAMEPEIQDLWATGEYSLRALSRKFGISKTAVARIIRST